MSDCITWVELLKHVMSFPEFALSYFGGVMHLELGLGLFEVWTWEPESQWFCPAVAYSA